MTFLVFLGILSLVAIGATARAVWNDGYRRIPARPSVAAVDEPSAAAETEPAPSARPRGAERPAEDPAHVSAPSPERPHGATRGTRRRRADGRQDRPAQRPIARS